jgi:F-type H+-transporting ATPase subunit delta
MPLLNTVTTPYVEAFLQVAEACEETDQVVEQAKVLLELWNQSPELREAMGSPVLEVESKKAAITELFGAQLTPTFLNLLKLLADRQRIGILGPVLERLLEIYREQRKIVVANVSSATALSEAQEQAIAKKLQVIAGTDQLEINLQVNPELIGGFVVSLGSQVIDASLAGQVRRLGLALTKVS